MLFVIGRAKLYFLLCFNFKSRTIDIIDNLDDNSDLDLKYGDIPRMMSEGLSKYLKKIGDSMAENVVKLDAKRLKMPWRSTDANKYCGVFAMHHMETYMGNMKS